MKELWCGVFIGLVVGSLGTLFVQHATRPNPGALAVLDSLNPPPPTPARARAVVMPSTQPTRPATAPVVFEAAPAPQPPEESEESKIFRGVPKFMREAAFDWIDQGKILNFPFKIEKPESLGRMSFYTVVRILDDNHMVVALGGRQEHVLLIATTKGLVDGRKYHAEHICVAVGTQKVDFSTMIAAVELDEQEEAQLVSVVKQICRLGGLREPDLSLIPEGSQPLPTTRRGRGGRQ